MRPIIHFLWVYLSTFLFLLFTGKCLAQALVETGEQYITLALGTESSITSILNAENGYTLPLSIIRELEGNQVKIDALDAGAIYRIIFNDGTEKYFATRSSSSGEIKVYFNYDVDSGVSDGSIPEATSIEILETDLIELIENAASTIDYCMYNTNRSSIVDALLKAHGRGVQVRIITDDQTNNYGFDNSLPFPVLRGNTGDDLMHNKFIVIDADSMMTSWVVTGSMNLTSSQMDLDPNHMVWIQDRSLAQAYTLEFEEMWGGTGASPDYQLSRFGRNKRDNTPHIFEIGGKMVELYFSPSDLTASHIGMTLDSCDETLRCGLLLFTHFVLRDKVLERKNAGVKVRMIIENTEVSSSVVEELIQGGVLVEGHVQDPLFHHKYAIIDEGTTSDPTVITGSHNWTYSADNYNDENTLIIHDQSAANIFRQEFQRWWAEFSTSVQELYTHENFMIFPNPVTDQLVVVSSEQIEDIALFDLSGRTAMQRKVNGTAHVIQLQSLKKGIYLLRINKNHWQRIMKL